MAKQERQEHQDNAQTWCLGQHVILLVVHLLTLLVVKKAKSPVHGVCLGMGTDNVQDFSAPSSSAMNTIDSLTSTLKAAAGFQFVVKDGIFEQRS